MQRTTGDDFDVICSTRHTTSVSEMSKTQETENITEPEEGENTPGSSVESVVTWLYPQGGKIEPTKTCPPDNQEQVNSEMPNPFAVSSWSSLFSSGGGLVSSALNKVSSGVAAATTSIKVISTAGEEEQQRQNEKEDEKILEEQKVELGFGVSSVLSKMGSATKALKQSVENTNIISEFNREQAKFIKEKKEAEANTGTVPWIGYRDEDGLRGKILELSKDQRNFIRSPPSGVTIDFEHESISGAALTLLKEDPNLHDMRFQLVPKIVKEDEFWRNYFYRVGLVRQQYELQELQDIENDTQVGNEDKSTSGKNLDIENEATRVDSGTKSTDVGEFVSESYLASSKDIAEADESIKRLRVSESTSEWEAELQGELNEYEVVKDSVEEDNPEWENQIQEMLDAEQIAKSGSKVSN